MIKAIRNTNQKAVEKAFKLLSKYNELDNQRNTAEAMDDERAYNKFDKQCEQTFERYLEAIQGLAKDEIDNIDETLYS